MPDLAARRRPPRLPDRNRTRSGRRHLWRAPHRFNEADPTGAVDLWDCVRRLSPDRREAFILTQLLGFSYSETGTVGRCTVGTVRPRVARAREDLEAMIAESSSISDLA